MDSSEIQFLNKKNIKYQILQSNLEAFYSERLKNQKFDKNIILSNDDFKFGSMGGFYTLDEVYNEFDRMRVKYPQFFMNYEIIGNTCENRPIYCYTLGSGSSTGKKEVFLSALHHAREPGGLMVLVYFLWDLLDKAGTGDKEALYLLQNRVICVVPVVNPDGYYYNQTNKPNGGGMWRKNRKRINDSTYGIDLNRNYGPPEFWNANVPDGSSTEPSHVLYRGTAPFSELETQAIRDFCYKHKFKMAMNYHSYSNLVIYPYSALSTETPDSLLYRYFASDITSGNKYCFGLDSATVGYHARGSAEDWMYKKDTGKDKIMSMTVEVGNILDGFWPTKDRMLEICMDNLYPNYQLVWSGDANLRPTRVYCSWDSIKGKPFIVVTLTNIGTDSIKTDAKVTVTSLTNAISVTASPLIIESLKSADLLNDRFEVSLNQNFINGNYYPFEIEINQDGVQRKDTFSVQFGKPDYINLFNGKSITNNWILNEWGIEYLINENRDVLSDSPGKFYHDTSNNYLYYKTAIDLTGLVNPTLEFITKWSLETNYDVAYVQASSDNGNTWHYLVTSRMNVGLGIKGSRFVLGTTGFTGTYPMWIKQECSLNNYFSQKINLRFGILSDPHLTFDGLYLDTIRIRYYKDLNYLEVNDKDIGEYIETMPNPVKRGEPLILKFNNTENAGNSSIKIIDLTGRELFHKILTNNNVAETYSILIDSFSPGFYFLKINYGRKIFYKKLIILN